MIQEATQCKYGKLIWGVVQDDRMEDEVIITIIATGFSSAEQIKSSDNVGKQNMPESRNLLLDFENDIKVKIPTTQKELQSYDVPPVLRNNKLSEQELLKIRTRGDEDTENLDFGGEDLNMDNESKPAFLRRQMD
jgi:hypothetical protein